MNEGEYLDGAGNAPGSQIRVGGTGASAMR